MFEQVVLVLGPHRSGTSLVAAAMETAGFELGTREPWSNDDNPKGFFENERVIAFNDHLLKRLGGRWDNPLFFGSTALAKLSPGDVEALLEDAVGMLHEDFPPDAGLIAI